MPRYDKPLNIMIDGQLHFMLTELSSRLNRSRGSVMRELLVRAHQMVCNSIPLCASGQRCYVPHMHPPSLPTPTAPGQLQIPDTSKGAPNAA